MNILVVLAVAAAFGVLRDLRAKLLTWAGAWWIGLHPLAIRLQCPDSLLRHRDLHGNRVARGPRLCLVQPGAREGSGRSCGS